MIVPLSSTVRLRPEIVALAAYKQGKPADSDAFKLSSNENPFDPIPEVVRAIAASSGVNRYPDAAGIELRTRLAGRFGVRIERRKSEYFHFTASLDSESRVFSTMRRDEFVDTKSDRDYATAVAARIGVALP